jgi:hypothetical protein
MTQECSSRRVAHSLGVTEALDQAKVDYVVREAVVAHIKKPDDATQVVISIDDGSSSRTYQSGKGRVSILDEWWTLLGLTESNGGAYSFDMAPSGARHLPWCAAMLGGNYCSCGVDIAGARSMRVAAGEPRGGPVSYQVWCDDAAAG